MVSENDLKSAKSKIALQDYADFSQEAGERLGYQIQYSHNMMRSLFLVNGGGILSLLTLIGNSEIPYDGRGIFWSFVWFGLGLLFSLTANFGAFFSQYGYMYVALKQAWNAQDKAVGIESSRDFSREETIGDRGFWTGLGSAALSFVFFVIAAFVSLFAIL